MLTETKWLNYLFLRNKRNFPLVPIPVLPFPPFEELIFAGDFLWSQANESLRFQCMNLNFAIWKAFLPLSYKLALEDQLHNFQDPVQNEYWELVFKLRILRWSQEGIKPNVRPCWADHQSGPVSSYAYVWFKCSLCLNSQEKSNTIKVCGRTFQP